MSSISSSPPPPSLGQDHPPTRLARPSSTSPTRSAKIDAAIPRLDSATSTSTSALPPMSPAGTDSVMSAALATTTQDASSSSRQRRTVRIASPPAAAAAAAHVSSDEEDRVGDFATERDRLLANHGLTDTDAAFGEDESAPLLQQASTSEQRVAAHRQARRQGMRTSGRTSQRTEFHTPLPWRALTLTVFLFSFGSIALSTSLYLFLGYGHAKDPDKWQPLAVLGSLCMIPGGFYLWHFLMVALGVPGWTYDDIPEL